MRNVSDKICIENYKTNFLLDNFFLFENRTFYEIMWKKYCSTGLAIGDNMAHAHCTLDT